LRLRLCLPRFQIVRRKPLLVLDGAQQYRLHPGPVETLWSVNRERLTVVFGLSGTSRPITARNPAPGCLAPDTHQADSPRALPVADLAAHARDMGLKFETANTVAEALVLVNESAVVTVPSLSAPTPCVTCIGRTDRAPRLPARPCLLGMARTANLDWRQLAPGWSSRAGALPTTTQLPAEASPGWASPGSRSYASRPAAGGSKSCLYPAWPGRQAPHGREWQDSTRASSCSMRAISDFSYMGLLINGDQEFSLKQHPQWQGLFVAEPTRKASAKPKSLTSSTRNSSSVVRPIPRLPSPLCSLTVPEETREAG